MANGQPASKNPIPKSGTRSVHEPNFFIILANAAHQRPVSSCIAVIRTLLRDAIEFARVSGPGELTPRKVIENALLHDGFAVLALTRVREVARRWHVPGVNRVVRLAQTALYGIEIGKDVSLGEGVCFVHTIGNVIGGNAELGARVRIMGNVTIGTAKDNGYPVIGDDVTLGAGARVLGPISIGRGAVIGANAVVLTDIPEGVTVAGVPAVVRRGTRDGGAERGVNR
jgi:serine O-acetyltransferase